MEAQSEVYRTPGPGSEGISGPATVSVSRIRIARNSRGLSRSTGREGNVTLRYRPIGGEQHRDRRIRVGTQLTMAFAESACPRGETLGGDLQPPAFPGWWNYHYLEPPYVYYPYNELRVLTTSAGCRGGAGATVPVPATGKEDDDDPDWP